jgi:hypothetical protein
MCCLESSGGGPRPAAGPLRALLLAAAGLAGALLPGAAAAQAEVGLAFERGDLPPTHADAAAVEPLLAEVLADELLGAWAFRPAAGETQPPRLVVSVELDEGDWLFVSRFEPAAGEASEPWRSPFFTAAEISARPGLPSPSTMPQELRARFAAALREKGWTERNRGALFVALQEGAPVAAGVHIVAGQRHALLARSDHDTPRLAHSRYRIACRDAAGRTRVLVSEATGACFPFPAPPPETAIEIQHLEMRDVGASHPITAADLEALGGLTPQRVLLDHLGENLGGCAGSAPRVVEDLP